MDFRLGFSYLEGSRQVSVGFRRWTFRLVAGLGSLAALLVCVALIPRLVLDTQLSSSEINQIGPVDKAKTLNEIRTAILQAIGGVAVLAGAYIAWRQLQENIASGREQRQLDRERKISEQFGQAVEQLASQALTLRLGGIYTLDRIGAESPSDHVAIVDILCALVRTTLPWPPADGSESAASVPPLRVRAIDAQAAVTVLSRWGPTPQPHDRWPTADLSAADLRMANFEGAHLWRVRLRGTNLTDANLRNADLRGADLEDSILGGADLRGAKADQSTWWPAGLDIAAAGVVVE